MESMSRALTYFVWAYAALFALGVKAADLQTERLIEQLPQVSDLGYGYSSMFSGSQFLPDPDASGVHTLVLGSKAPSNSVVLESIVRRGVLAVPAILKHLDDARPTKIPAVSGMMWMSFDDEYDYNRRLRKDVPTGVNKDTFGQDQPDSHTITVGDLCFVALGQIVNRSFNATRYQPTGGLVVSSPTYSKRLCAVVRADFEGLTEKKHRELLAQDFQMPDFAERRNGACRRIAFYYPESLESLVLVQLATPICNTFKVDEFLRIHLYRNESPNELKTHFDEFFRVNGKACSNCFSVELFDALETQEADQEGRVTPPLKEKYDARPLLAQLGYDKSVNSTNRPHRLRWDRIELADFIKALGHPKSPKIDEAVHAVFANVGDDDYLAIPCMNRLIGSLYDEEIRRYCERRITESKLQAGLRAVLSKLDASRTNDTKRNVTKGPPR
jgi:hypothetical protein